MKHLSELPAWRQLWPHYEEMKSVHMRDLFAQDPDRARRYWLEVGGLTLDYAKNRITDQTLNGLFELARESGLPERKSTTPKTAPPCTSPCATAPTRRFMWTAKTSCPKSIPYSGIWGSFHMPSATVIGRAIPAKPSPTSSISASAVPTKAR